MGHARRTDSTRHHPAPTTWARVAAVFVRAAGAEGLPAGELLARAGIAETDLADPDGRVPLESVYALTEACEELGGELVHLRMTTHVKPESMDALAFLFMTSPTFGEGLRAMLRYQRVWCEGERYELVEGHGRARLVYTPWGPARPAHRLMAEMFAVDMLVNGVQMLGGLEGARAAFAHGPPSDRAAHAAILGVEADFDAPRNEIDLPASVLEAPLGVPGQEGMRAFFERHLEERMRALPPETTSGRVLAALLGEGEGEPELGRLARRLHMSSRTLQRRLADEGTSLRALADEARRARAVTLLEGGASIAEVAYVLGYSEPSAFHRAFRRWTGRTPEAFRSSLTH